MNRENFLLYSARFADKPEQFPGYIPLAEPTVASLQSTVRALQIENLGYEIKALEIQIRDAIVRADVSTMQGLNMVVDDVTLLGLKRGKAQQLLALLEKQESQV